MTTNFTFVAEQVIRRKSVGSLKKTVRSAYVKPNEHKNTPQPLRVVIVYFGSLILWHRMRLAVFVRANRLIETHF